MADKLPHQVVMTQNVSLGTDDNAVLVLNEIIAPWAGAQIYEASLTITTAAPSTAATFTWLLEEAGTATALTETSPTLNADEPIYTVSILKGPGAGAAGARLNTKGKPVEANLQYSAATGVAAAVGTFRVVWV